MNNPARPDSRSPPPLPPRATRPRPPPPTTSNTADTEWPIIFNDLVLHQRELMRKAFERYSFAKTFLFSWEERSAQVYMKQIETGLNNFVRLVEEQNSYIDFGSGKVEPIVGARGRASAIIHLLESTNRAFADFNRFLDRTTTPEAVRSKCEALPEGQCALPCTQEKSFFGRKRCGYD